MAKFISTKTFKLDFLDKNWKDCFMVFTALSITENKDILEMKLGTKTPVELTNLSIKMLEKHFVEGVGYDAESKSVVPITKKDLRELPNDIKDQAILFLVGGSTPKQI